MQITRPTKQPCIDIRQAMLNGGMFASGRTRSHARYWANNGQVRASGLTTRSRMTKADIVKIDMI